MKYERKIFQGLLIAAGAFLPLVALALFSIHQVITAQNTVIESTARESLLIERLQFFNAAQSRHMLLYVMTRDKDHMSSFQEFHRVFNLTLLELIQVKAEANETTGLQKIRTDADKVFSLQQNEMIMADSGKTPRAIAHYIQYRTAPMSKALAEETRRLAINAAQNQLSARTQRERTVSKLEWSILGLGILAAGLLAWAISLVAKVMRQKRMYDEQAAQISQARKEIVEVVAHDVKSPIATIQMTTDLLKEELSQHLDIEKIRQSVGIIERSADTVHKLISDLLDHSKIEAGNLVLESQDCHLEKIVEDVVLRFQMLAQAKQISFVLQLPEVPLPHFCDSGRIDQAISNLVSNAIKFTPQNGTIRVSCKRVEDGVEISVDDSGPGMAQEQLSHVFDRYWQARKTSQQGTGLGLAIVKAIVDAHHGQVSVASEVGKGTQFRIDLPLPQQIPVS